MFFARKSSGYLDYCIFDCENLALISEINPKLLYTLRFYVVQPIVEAEELVQEILFHIDESLVIFGMC
jgi:hypothetical protein